MPPVAEIDPELKAQRRVSTERIQGYESIPSVGGRHGAIVRELGRVAERDPEFALEIVRDFELDLKINALTIIGTATGEVGPLSDARDHAESADLEPAKKSRKLAGIAKAAADIDAQFAFETASAIPRSAPKIDTLLEIAKRSKIIDGLNQSNVERFGAAPKDINFSIDLFREIVREVDQEIDSSNMFSSDPYRNRRLAEVSAGFDLDITHRAEKRQIEATEHERTKPIDVDAVALHGVQRHIRSYIKEGDFEGLEEADPSGELTIAAFKARVSEYGGEGDRLGIRLGFKDELLDPVTDAASLLRHLDHMRVITWQNPNQELHQRLYRALLPVIHDGASVQVEEFDKRQEEAEEHTEALESYSSREP